MDILLSQQQRALQESARSFFEQACPEELVRAMEEDERGYSAELWQKMASRGWLGLIIPKEYGGQGQTFCEMAVLLEELGRALAPVPFVPTAVDTTIPISEFGTSAQKEAYLPRIARGDVIMTFALTEPSGRWDAQGIRLVATAEGDNYVLNGTKLFVESAHVADAMVVAARTRPSQPPEDGITCFIVDRYSAGLACTPLATIAADKQYQVSFQDVRVPAANVLGPVDGGWEVIASLRPKAVVARCAYLVGLAQMDFDITLNYAKERMQFDRPIGSFQALQHRFADMVADLEGSRYITYNAAWTAAAAEAAADLAASVAKAWCGEASRRVVAEGQQLHGAIGFTKDYKLQLFFRRQRWLDLMWGDADYHREQVARMLSI